MKVVASALFALSLQVTPALGQDEVRFSGSTRGCFGIDCTPTSRAGTDYLNFTGLPFDGVTDDGFLRLNLGYFTWDSFTGIDHVDSPFTLFLSFVNPTGISPAPVYDGSAEGWIIRGRLWGYSIGLSTTRLMFEPNVRHYAFTGGQPNSPGRFTLTVNDTYIAANGPSYITAHVSNAQTNATVTPEPMTVLLLGTGLAGLAGAARRRRKNR